MKKFFCALLITALLPSVSQAGNPALCYSIKNQDQKNQCLAVTQNQKALCYSIKDSDMKNACLAQVGGEQSRCYSIKDREQKERCLAEY
ncbi:hypothetical protein SAMN05216296_0030 [Pseudomonas pohangensis]|uniref:Cysteine rich repeat-containing protein n=1 Tax=Pseudomonas pohangensis TaxID=364197 RepID=A0A1H2DUW2_9PSED|nr:hypothetical protein [Pseudomonas pohangensis]SDT86655.1 hypothetical protein SAMN05216296_0030 [Pseudomonas pohangensis]